MKRILAAVLATVAIASIVPANAQTYARTDVITYEDNLSKWVVGQPKSSTNVDTGLIESRTVYDPVTALPLQSFAFEKLQQTMSYNADGTLATTTDGNNRTTTYTEWKRGIPQKVTFADSTFKSALVDDSGWIRWVQDESGFRTNYGYDAMGRLSLIDYPDGDTVNWNSTTISFALAAATPYGLPAGHWRRIESTGTARKITYYDAFWRPVLQEVYDTADTWGTITQTITRYDADGRPTFTSYPQRSADPAVYSTWANPAVSPNALGTWTSYDALGRPTQVQQNSELGLLTSTYAYLSGFQTRSTNPRGYQTTTSYLTYDQPTTDWPRVIAHPEGAYTTIFRDVFGKPTHLVRSTADNSEWNGRYYAYDPYQRLCKQSELETGTTAFGYDNAGNLVWSAASLPWSTSEPCEYTANHASVVLRRVDRGYDARNRLQTLSFPDGRGNQSWEYWPDGLAKKITTYNETAQGGVVENTYAYNKRRLLTSETQAQPDHPLWGMAYGYSTNAALASLTYPSGLSVNYAPNALGQPTQAGSYATGVSYFANGGMAQFTYGNGIVHTLAQNARQLPDQSVDSGGVLNDSYDYDANGNVAAISDGLAGARGNRTMSYDGLDRLTAATSPMFPGGTLYEYDKLDNLTRVKAPGRDHYYCYDAHKWLTNVKTGSCSGTSVIGLGYDERGNLANKNGQLYQFDYGNRLRNVPNQESYRYDGHGRRISAQATQGTIYSLYGQDGALRSQRDERKGEAYHYITLNGSLVARVTDPAPVIGVPMLSAPASSSNGTYTLQWTAVTLATQYEVQEALNGGAWQAAYAGAATSLNLSSQPSGSYGYRARACKNAVCGNWSATATVVVALPPASAPTLTVPATAPNGNYSVGWTTVNGATSYTLEESVNGGAWAQAYNGANLSQPYTSKPAGTYAYRIKACNPNGCSGVSATATTQAIYAPGAPTLSVPASSYTGNYTVSWAAVSGATSYQLEESANGGAWTLVQNSAATSKAYTGKADGSYSYRAKACNAAGCSSLSATAGISVLTPPTTVPTVTAPANNTTGSYAVSWTTVPKATSYTLHVKVNGAVNGTNIYSGAGTSRNVSGQGDGSYAYYVLACNGAGCSNWSAPATTHVTLVPAMPANLTGYTEPDPDLQGSRYFYVYWSAVLGATYYELTTTGIGAGVYNITGTSFSTSGKGNPRGFSVRACNPAGCSAPKGPLSL